MGDLRTAPWLMPKIWRRESVCRSPAPCQSALGSVSDTLAGHEIALHGSSNMAFKVAVVGATGVVGHEMLSILAEREFPVSEVCAVASERSAGGEVSFGEDDVLKVQDLCKVDFKGVDIARVAPCANVSSLPAPRGATTR